jgi:hypothetical protein
MYCRLGDMDKIVFCEAQPVRAPDEGSSAESIVNNSLTAIVIHQPMTFEA